MKLLSIILFFLFTIFFFSCSNSKKSDPQPSNATATIIGSWTLQKQHVILYDNNVLQGDTVINSSQTTTATVKFGNDGTYKSLSSYYYTNANGSLSGPFGMNLSGAYTYSDLSFDDVPVLAGWYGFYLVSPAPIGDTLQAKVTLLTSTALHIHYNVVGNHVSDGNNVVHNYAEQMDYYYIKP